MFEHEGMTAPAYDSTDPAETFDDSFDDSDGAYAVHEPDPFSDLINSSADVPAAIPLRRTSLRAELGSAPGGPTSGFSSSALPVPDGLSQLMPHGLRRGSTIAVTSSVSLLLTLLGGPSAHGAWTAMVGMPSISAEAATAAGVNLERLALINNPDGGWTGASWTTAVGVLLDAVDVVVARPGASPSAGVSAGDARRLTARARSKDAVLVLFGQRAESWPALELRLSARHGSWIGIGDGYGRLTQRQLLVTATGKGRSARPRNIELWL